MREYTCQEIVELASDYLEGAMTADRMTMFELHLNFCDGCIHFVDQIRVTAATAGSAVEEQIPAELKTTLLRAFRDWQRE
jgi:hypothetical protein